MRSSPIPQKPCGGPDHALALYDDEQDLAASVAGYLAEGMRAGEGAVVIVTPEHRQRLCDALTRCHVDVDYASRSGRLLALDAAETLQTFMTPTGPDIARCASTVGAALDRAAQGGRPIRYYGEMLGLLWDAGDVASAMRLEQLGNAMATQRDCSLLCGYSSALFAASGTAADFERLCELHTRVLPCDADADADIRPGHPPALRVVPRQRYLGLCAGCREPVSHDEQFVRLHRQAWHLQCALESDTSY